MLPPQATSILRSGAANRPIAMRNAVTAMLTCQLLKSAILSVRIKVVRRRETVGVA